MDAFTRSINNTGIQVKNRKRILGCLIKVGASLIELMMGNILLK